MAARYLQEQVSGADVGSLLMGFLDYFGNHFEPRMTGISVRHRMFFTRPRNPNRPPMWPEVVPVNPATISVNPAAVPVTTTPGGLAFHRRNSFSDRKSADFLVGRTPKTIPRPSAATFQQPPTFYPPPDALTSDPLHGDQNAYDHGMPYTFDPLFVEDPLSEGNNVGRNAFRIFQVQRAFSDAHRALVAALEWDMHSTGESQDTNEFPLLKCLLQSEDVVLDL